MRRLVSAMVVAVLAGTAAASWVGAPAVWAAGCSGGLSASELNTLIRGGVHGPGGLAGMDYAHVHTLPDGRVLWLFQDVFLGDVTDLDDGAFVHNAGLLQFGSCLRALYSGTAAQPKSWIGASGERGLSHWFWPLDGAMGADGQFQQFMVEMNNPNGTGAAPGATPVRVWVASIRLSDMAVTRLAPAPDDHDRPLYGFSITSDDSWTYLYGHCYRQFTNPGYIGSHDLTCARDVYLARVPVGQFSSEPTYWDGSGWGQDRAAAVPVDQQGAFANPMQVRHIGDTYVSIKKIDDWFGLTVYVETATAPQGPWQEVSHFQPDLVCAQCTTYFAHLLPWGAADGSMLVVISNNSWYPSYTRLHPRVYRPRVISVRPPPGVTMPPAPSDCVVTRLLKPGSTGPDVACLRKRLARLGFTVATNRSTYDKSVRSAVSAFQHARGLNADGIAGPDTGTALGIRGLTMVAPGPTPGPKSCAVTSTLRLGSKGSQVTCLVTRLRHVGYTVSDALGVFGPSTRAAVAQFQSSQGLNADGIAGPATRRALGF